MKDRKALNELIQKEKRSYDEENFDEALAASFRACRKTEIPPEIQAILHDSKAINLTPQVLPLFISLFLHPYFPILVRTSCHYRIMRTCTNS